MNRLVHTALLTSLITLTATAQEGGLDLSFNPGTAVNSANESMSILADGKILITGHFSGRIKRLNSDGSLDDSFQTPPSGPSILYAHAVQSDGKIVVGGLFSTYHGVERNGILRINADGSVDTSFDPGTGTDDHYITDLAIQPDGKIVAVGRFTSFNGVARGGIVRLHPDGTVDSSFDPGTGVSGFEPATAIMDMDLTTDGKILIAGTFNAYNGTSTGRAARINSDGSLDNTFAALGASGGAGAITVVDLVTAQPDGKVLIGGHFSHVSGSSRNSIARLNTDGTLDASFNPGTGAQTTWGTKTTAIHVLGNGKILLGGQFNTYAGVARRGIARLNADGSLDTTFDPGTGIFHSAASYGNIQGFAVQADGRVVIAGYFTDYNGTERHGAARLHMDVAAGIHDRATPALLAIHPNPATDFIFLADIPPGAKVRITDMTGRLVHHDSTLYDRSMLNVATLPNGTYIVLATHDTHRYSGRLIVQR